MEELGGSGAGSRGQRPRRILVVEPLYQRRIHAAQLVAQLGFRVVLADGPDEAVSVIMRQAERLDAVLARLTEESEAVLKATMASHRPDLPFLTWGAETYSLSGLRKLLGPSRVGR